MICLEHVIQFPCVQTELDAAIFLSDDVQRVDKWASGFSDDVPFWLVSYQNFFDTFITDPFTPFCLLVLVLSKSVPWPLLIQESIYPMPYFSYAAYV